MLPNNSESVRQIYRTDQLVGCENLLSFAEFLVKHFSGGIPNPVTFLSLDVNSISRLNAEKGHDKGDAALRWIGIVFVEQSRAPVYRIAGDEFVVALVNPNQEENENLARDIFDRINADANRFCLVAPAISMAVVHYTGRQAAMPADVFVQLGAAILAAKENPEQVKVFKDGAIPGTSFYPGQETGIPDAVTTAPVEMASLRWIAELMVDRVISLAAMLEESQHLAYTDPLTGLPNLRAAQRQLQIALARAAANETPLSILLIDGDDLRRYNQISYAAGDEMILGLATALAQHLRPGDFLSRWHVGDEFLVVLSNSHISQAILVAERLCRAVQQASSSWPLPITISIGVAGCTGSLQGFSLGQARDALLHAAEVANSQAKVQGKNRVMSAPLLTSSAGHKQESIFHASGLNPLGQV